MGERTYWRDDEWERIVQLATPKILENPKVSIIQAVQAVQGEAIEESRRRKLPNIGSIRSDIRFRLDALRKSPDEATVPVERYQEIQEMLGVANARIKHLLEENAKLQQVNQGLAANKPRPPIEVLKDFFSDIFADAQRKLQTTTVVISNAFPEKEKKQEVIDAQSPKKHVSEMEPSGIRKPRVVVVGGSPERHAALSMKYGDDLELRFFNGSKERGRIGDQLRAYKDPSFGKIILWADYCGHDVKGSLTNQNIPYENFKGEFNSLKARLEKFIRGGGPAR